MDTKSILIVDDIEDILDLYEIILEGEFNSKIIRATSSTEAIEILKTNDSIELIISDMNMPNGNGDLLLDYNMKERKTPFILSTSNSISELPPKAQKQLLEGSHNYYIGKPSSKEVFLKMVTQAFGQQMVSASSMNLNKIIYRRVQINYLKSLIHNNANIFIKIGDKKFIKIVHENDLQESTQLDKYQLRGEKYAYVTEDDFAPLIEKLMNNINKRIDSTTNVLDLLEVGAEGYALVNESLDQLEVSISQREYVTGFIRKCISQLNTSSVASSLLKNFYKQKIYLVGHSLLTIHISNLIIRRTEFSNTKQLEKLSYAGLLHDITFIKHDLSEVIDKDSTYEELNNEEKAIIKEHISKSAELIDRLPHVSEDVKTIILNHHEKCNGTGFPQGLRGNKISPLSAIFILSLRTAHFMITQDFPSQKSKLIKDLLENYNSGNFKDPLKSLMKTIDR